MAAQEVQKRRHEKGEAEMRAQRAESIGSALLLDLRNGTKDTQLARDYAEGLLTRIESIIHDENSRCDPELHLECVSLPLRSGSMFNVVLQDEGACGSKEQRFAIAQRGRKASRSIYSGNFYRMHCCDVMHVHFAAPLSYLFVLLQAEHREWDQMLGSPSPKKMISNGHLPDIHNKDVRNKRMNPPRC